ncbi:hypothetical protein V2G26_010806 [Clonostachys chloroleuca]
MARSSRRPNATACDACRDKKLKCIGDNHDTCDKCKSSGKECIRPTQHQNQIRDGFTASNPLAAPSSSPSPLQPGFSHASDCEIEHPPLPHHDPGPSTDPIEQFPLGQPPQGRELEDLVQLYFTSVHHNVEFGFFAFVHQLQFNRLLAKGKEPRELTLMMIASAVRSAADPTPENLAKADAWADRAIAAVLPRIYQGFGVVQLMTLLLVQAYELNRGNFSSAWILGGNCTKMMQTMSLQTFDRTYPSYLTSDSNSKHLPLLSSEALRRVTWSTFYFDTIIDAITTEPLHYDEADKPESSTQGQHLKGSALGISAYLMRTAAARRRALFFVFRASHKEDSGEKLIAELAALEADIEHFVSALPRRFHLPNDNLFLHRERLGTFILLHVLRHNLFIIVGRASLQIFKRDLSKADLIPQAGIALDPQLGVHTYIALEILLFEPLTVVRSLSARAEFVKHLYIEAVHRLLRFEYNYLLSQEDLAASRSEYRILCQETAELDFREFRWAKIERLRRGAKYSANTNRDEDLLEYNVGGDTATPSAAPSPKLTPSMLVAP